MDLFNQEIRSKAMSTNSFVSRKFEDFEIVDGNGNKVGEIRVKPSGVLWARKGTHNWLGVDLNTFADFMEQKGKKQKK